MGGSGSGRMGSPLREAQVDEFAKLNDWSNSPNDSMQLRANVVLLLIGGMSVKDVAERLGVNQKTIYGWRNRWNAKGLSGLHTRQKRVDESSVGVNISLKRKIEELDSTDIDRKELKGLVLQFVRDVRRDKHDETDRTGAKLQLEGLKLLERLIDDDSPDNSDLPGFMRS